MIRDITNTLPKQVNLSYMGVISEFENESFFSKAISMCSGLDQFKGQIRQNYFMENTIINEGVSDSYFVAMIRTIIDYFVNIIKEVTERFIYILGKFTKTKVSIEKYSREILKFDRNITIQDFRHYNYTNLDADIPPSLLNMKFIEEYDTLYDTLCKFGRETDKPKLVTSLQKYYTQLKDNYKNEEIHKLRGYVLGWTTPCSRELYSEELFKVFRGGGLSSFESITPGQIEESYRRWKNVDILKNTVKKQKDTIISNANMVKKKVRDIKLSQITDGNYKTDYQLESCLQQILSAECDKLASTCSIVVLAYGAKLDAIKEAVENDKKILYACISEIVGGGN